jgi:hypothetical protein
MRAISLVHGHDRHSLCCAPTQIAAWADAPSLRTYTELRRVIEPAMRLPSIAYPWRLFARSRGTDPLPVLRSPAALLLLLVFARASLSAIVRGEFGAGWWSVPIVGMELENVE